MGDPRIDAAVTASLEEQKGIYIKAIESQKAAAEADIQTKADNLQYQDRVFSDSVSGFKLGIVAPAYAGTQAGVLERNALKFNLPDPSFSDPAPDPAAGHSPYLLIGLSVALYWIFFNKKRGK